MLVLVSGDSISPPAEVLKRQKSFRLQGLSKLKLVTRVLSRCMGEGGILLDWMRTCR